MNAQSIMSAIETENFTGKIRDLYGSSLSVEKQKERYRNVTSGFARRFGDTGDIRIYSAPGRTEIGGNHTDHQHGRVLAAAVNADIICAASPCDEERVTVVSEGFGEFSLSLADLEPREENYGKTEALIAGVFGAMKSRGYKIGGFKGYMSSQVPGGSGLSSSAAFEILIGYIISEMFNNSAVSAVELAEMGQFSENVFFGKPCGLMDQLVSSMGGLVYIDFADPAQPAAERVSFDFSHCGHALCIVSCGADHANLTADYAAIPDELARVCAVFGKTYLREVDEEDFCRQLPAVRAAAGDRAVLRAMHVYDENRRVRAEVQALRAGDFARFLALVNASGNSSWEYLQNITPAGAAARQDMALTLALCRHLLAGTGAVRVHGGGFAGTALSIVPEERIPCFTAGLERALAPGCCRVLRVG